MKKTVIYCLLTLLVSAAAAQDVNITTDYPAVVAEGQQFSITYSVNAGGGELAVPTFRGFNRIMGPQTSYSENTQIYNGRVTKTVNYSYVYYVLAQKTGKFVIPPAVFTLKGKEYYSDSLRIEVVADASQAQDAGESQGTSKSDLYVSLFVNKDEVYVGEPVTATVKLFTRVDLQGINEIKYPSFNNFLRNDIETPPLTSLRQENVNGSVYGTGIIQRFLLYPQISGDITIDPVQISALVQQRTNNPDPFFGDFFSSYQTIPKTISSRPVKITVKPLPGNKPVDFSGVVGNLRINASLNSDSVGVNEAINFKVTVAGSGNLRIASAPQLKVSADIEVYDPKVTEDITTDLAGMSGSKTFEYLLIPRHHGDFTIPPLSYSYFNTSTGRYETLTTGEFIFHARRGEEQAGGITVYSGVSKEDVKYLGKDIRFIKSDSGKLFRVSGVLTSSRVYYSVFGFAFLTFLLVLFVRREHVRRNSDISLVRNRKAGKVAVRRLHAAAVCLKNNHLDKFHEEILKAIWGYLSDKLNIPVASLTRVSAVDALRSRGVEDSVISDLNQILDTSEFARFAPSASGMEAEHVYETASGFIRSVENTLR